MSDETDLAFTQGMICGAAVLECGNMDDLLGCCGRIPWSKIEQGDIDILIKCQGLTILKKYGYKEPSENE